MIIEKLQYVVIPTKKKKKVRKEHEKKSTAILFTSSRSSIFDILGLTLLSKTSPPIFNDELLVGGNLLSIERIIRVHVLCDTHIDRVLPLDRYEMDDKLLDRTGTTLAVVEVIP